MADYDVDVCRFEKGSLVQGGEDTWRRVQSSYSKPEELAWRIEDAPDGGCAALVTNDQGRLVSRILGALRPARLDGQDVSFLEVFDVFNDFDGGKGLERARGLQRCGEAFAKSFAGRHRKRSQSFSASPTAVLIVLVCAVSPGRFFVPKPSYASAPKDFIHNLQAMLKSSRSIVSKATSILFANRLPGDAGRCFFAIRND